MPKYEFFQPSGEWYNQLFVGTGVVDLIWGPEIPYSWGDGVCLSGNPPTGNPSISTFPYWDYPHIWTT
jgi:hypothetical protein